MTTSIRTAAGFEARYRAAADPWSFGSSPYELARYERTLAALPRPRYRNALEPGCSIGVLTVRLAERCDRVDALDVAPTAVAAARHRCRRLRHVEVTVGEWPDDTPARSYELFVLSEIAYYTGRRELATAMSTLERHADPDADLAAVHWLGHSDDHVLHGDDVHNLIDARAGWTHLVGERHETARADGGFRLDIWRRSS